MATTHHEMTVVIKVDDLVIGEIRDLQRKLDEIRTPTPSGVVLASLCGVAVAAGAKRPVSRRSLFTFGWLRSRR